MTKEPRPASTKDAERGFLFACEMIFFTILRETSEPLWLLRNIALRFHDLRVKPREVT